MADATSTTPQPAGKTANKVEIEDVGPATKRLTITIPSEAVAQKLKESLGTLANVTSIPGFRRGKVPRRLLEKRFGTAMRDETKNKLIADAYAKAIEEHHVEPVGEPEPTEPTDKLQIEEGKPLTFVFDVEVVPEFELPPLEGVEITKPILEITEEHIETELTRQLQQLGTPNRIEGDFQPGDRLFAHVTVTKNDEKEPFFQEDQAVIIVPGTAEGGRGPVLGLMVENLQDLLKDKRVGDTIIIETIGPEAHERDDLRGAKLTMTLRLTAAERTEPATAQRLIEVYGLGSEENLREQIRLTLQQRRDQEQITIMREQVYDYLLGGVDFELPEKLSVAQVARSLEGHRIELLYRGLTPDEVEGRLAEIRAESEAQARDRLKLAFLLRRLAGHFNIEVSQQEINGRLAAIAIHRGQRPEQLRSELARTGRLGEVARVLREHKAADRVIAQATVKEISADEWAKSGPGKATTAKPPAEKKQKTAKTARKPATSGTAPHKKTTPGKK